MSRHGMPTIPPWNDHQCWHLITEKAPANFIICNEDNYQQLLVHRKEVLDATPALGAQADQQARTVATTKHVRVKEAISFNTCRDAWDHLHSLHPCHRTLCTCFTLGSNYEWHRDSRDYDYFYRVTLTNYVFIQPYLDHSLIKQTITEGGPVVFQLDEQANTFVKEFPDYVIRTRREHCHHSDGYPKVAFDPKLEQRRKKRWDDKQAARIHGGDIHHDVLRAFGDALWAHWHSIKLPESCSLGYCSMSSNGYVQTHPETEAQRRETTDWVPTAVASVEQFYRTFDWLVKHPDHRDIYRKLRVDTTYRSTLRALKPYIPYYRERGTAFAAFLDRELRAIKCVSLERRDKDLKRRKEAA